MFLLKLEIMVSKLETESETRLVLYEIAAFKGEVNK